MIDVTSLSAYDLSQKLYSGEISSLDLCKAYLDRIKKFEKDVQAWQFLDKKLLLEKAEKLTLIENLENLWDHCTECQLQLRIL